MIFILFNLKMYAFACFFPFLFLYLFSHSEQIKWNLTWFCNFISSPYHTFLHIQLFLLHIKINVYHILFPLTDKKNKSFPKYIFLSMIFITFGNQLEELTHHMHLFVSFIFLLFFMLFLFTCCNCHLWDKF